MDYKRLGYFDNWINQRLKSIEIRKDLTDQWKAHNVEEGVGYATLTDIIYQAETLLAEKMGVAPSMAESSTTVHELVKSLNEFIA